MENSISGSSVFHRRYRTGRFENQAIAHTCSKRKIKEVMLASNPSLGVQVTRLARGLPVGRALEYADARGKSHPVEDIIAAVEAGYYGEMGLLDLWDAGIDSEILSSENEVLSSTWHVAGKQIEILWKQATILISRK